MNLKFWKRYPTVAELREVADKAKMSAELSIHRAHLNLLDDKPQSFWRLSLVHSKTGVFSEAAAVGFRRDILSAVYSKNILVNCWEIDQEAYTLLFQKLSILDYFKYRGISPEGLSFGDLIRP